MIRWHLASMGTNCVRPGMLELCVSRLITYNHACLSVWDIGVCDSSADREEVPACEPGYVG